jgi:PKD repeat protein
MYTRHWKVLFVLVLLIASTLGIEGRANTLYVSPTGNDANNGSLASPLATPDRAIGLAMSGDTIYFRAGQYTITKVLYIQKDSLTLAAYPNEAAIFVGSTTDPNLTRLISIYGSNVSVIGLDLRGGYEYTIKSESNRGTVLRNCRISGSGRDCVKMFNADQMLIEGCDIGPSGGRDASNAEGIDSVGSRGVVIRGNYVHDTTTVGLYVKGGAADCIVENNRVERTGHAGILLGQDTDLEYMRDGVQYEAINCVARNNIVMRTGGAGLGTYSGSNVRFENNTLYDVARSLQAGLYVVTNHREVPSQRVLFKNNVVVVTSARPVFFVINLSDQLLSDHNLFYNPGGSYGFWRESGQYGDYWGSLAKWQAGMAADAKSNVADPLLDAAAAYKPKAGSPAIDRGETLAEVPLDCSNTARPQGAAHDIGAHEIASGGGANQPPQGSIAASTVSGPAPLSVNFQARVTDPDGQIVAYNWDFGDGQTSTSPAPSHVYQRAGSYTARLIVTDNAGATGAASINIVATATAPIPPQVLLMTPNVKEILIGRRIYSITWSASGDSLNQITLQLTTDNGATWRNIINSLPGTARSYNWRIPRISTTTARIRVIVKSLTASAMDESDVNFSIVRRQ